MILKKDILIVDFEVTGFDVDNDEPVQLGFVLLDKDTFEEKQSFISWIKPKQELNPDLAGFKWATIKEKEISQIEKAQPLNVVAEKVFEVLPNDFTFSSWNVVFDFFFWKKLLKEVGEVPKTNWLLDLWTLAYSKLLKDEDYKHDKVSSELTFQYFGLPPRKKHDALEDARMEAEILRKLLKD